MAMANERGYVIGSGWRRVITMWKPNIETGQMERMPSHDAWAAQFQPVEPLVRRAALYADTIVYPVNNFLPQAQIAYAEYLENAGVLKRVFITIPDDGSPQAQLLRAMAEMGNAIGGPTPVPKMLAVHHVQIYKHLEAQSPGNWAFATISEGMDFPDDMAVARRGLKIELTDWLPVPPPELGYDQILDFKVKRRDQLLAMRAELDAFYRRIINDQDVPDAKSRELEKLQAALLDVRRLMTERHWKINFEGLGLDLSLADAWEAIGGLGKIVMGAATFSLPTVIGGVASCIKIKGTFAPSPVEQAGVWGYIYNAAKEGIIDPQSIGEAPVSPG
jgi:hypothetical protein